ncbi:DUF5681 domain-containing protein [Luteimonas sp. FXH3W]|uniref:DUF5681 domain-containing protein n=1 Tax=Aquilutibacter rugosus TaxID=3115820 RepID=A0ABU7V0U8_9GAMM
MENHRSRPSVKQPVKNNMATGKFKKGTSGNPNGRPKGSVNKSTTEFRQTVQQLLDDNRENVGKWLETVAADDPYKALQVLNSLAEYAAPKLSRTELSGDSENPLSVVTRVELIGG